MIFCHFCCTCVKPRCTQLILVPDFSSLVYTLLWRVLGYTSGGACKSLVFSRKPITATSQTFSFVWMSLFGLFVYLCSIFFISCWIKWEGKRLKINTLRPSLKEGHVNVRHQNVPLLIVTLLFFLLEVSFLFRGRVVFESSQSILNHRFSILFPTFIISCKDIHNSCEGGAKFFSFFFFFPPSW